MTGLRERITRELDDMEASLTSAKNEYADSETQEIAADAAEIGLSVVRRIRAALTDANNKGAPEPQTCPACGGTKATPGRVRRYPGGIQPCIHPFHEQEEATSND